MKLTIVDLEFNQPSKALIQIGAVSLHLKTGEILSEFDTFVNPRETIDSYIQDLCHISQAQVDSAPDLRTALGKFWGWVDGKAIGAWGGDVAHLTSLSRDLGIDYPHIRVYDLLGMGAILRSAIPGASSGGLLKTMHAFGMKFEGQQHNALVDARNTARLTYKWISIIQKFNKIQEVMNDLA